MRQIICGVSGALGDEAAFDWAARRAFADGTPLRLATMGPDAGSLMGHQAREEARRGAERLVSSTAARLRGRWPSLWIGTLALLADPVASFASLSRQASLIVLGTDRHPDPHGEHAGSIAYTVSLISRCPVVMVPGSTHFGRDIIVGVDGSPGSTAALHWAVEEAAARSQMLRLVHACEKGIPDCSVLDDALEQLAVDGHQQAVGVVERCDPGRALIRHASEASLIVVGRRQRSAARRRAGSLIAGLLAGSPAPVVVIPPS